jgi:hypothetical protein
VKSGGQKRENRAEKRGVLSGKGRERRTKGFVHFDGTPDAALRAASGVKTIYFQLVIWAQFLIKE